MYYIRQNGNKVELDGTEQYYILCVDCGQEISIDTDDFLDVVEKNGIYGVAWYCESCVKRQIIDEARSYFKYKK